MSAATVVGFIALYWIVAVVFRFIRSILLQRRFARATKYLPEPPSVHPLYGWVAGLQKHVKRRLDWINDVYDDAAKLLGRPVLTIKLPPTFVNPSSGVIHTKDPRNVQHILKDKFDVYVKSLPPNLKVPYVDLFREWMGDGIFVIDHGPHAADKGESWFWQRKKASTIFTIGAFRTLIREAIVERTNTLIKRLQSTTGPVDMQDLFFRLTMDTFGRIGFGTPFNTVMDQENSYAQAFDRAHLCVVRWGQGERQKYVTMIMLLVPFPLTKLFLKLLRIVDPISQEFAKEVRILHEYSLKMIAERRKSKVPSNDIITMFMNETYDDGSVISDKLLTDIIMNFMIAGRDTTACLLSWTFYELSRHPEVLAKVRNEIDEMLPADEDPTYDTVKQMKYLRGVLMETLRIWPPVPSDGKVAAADDVLPDGTVILKGTRVAYFPYGMGRSEAIWEKPEKFDPDRWTQSSEKSQYEFPVFQAGPRICLGKDMAMMEAMTATAMLLRKFNFELVPGQDITYGRLITMNISPKLMMNVKPL